VISPPPPGPGAAALRPPPAPGLAGEPARAGRPHILVVNGRKVRHPVFVIGAPHSGTGLLAAALKRSPGFHMTLGQRFVAPVLHAFARTPALARDRPGAAATVLRDALAQGWQVSPGSCLACSPQCREAGGITGSGPCVAERAITRYGDASPGLLYSVDWLLDAFPDARLVQVIRDGRDVVAAMLSDDTARAWFRPGFVNLDGEAAHPLLGLEGPADRARWAAASLTARCALHWRGSARLAARLRDRLPADQLITVRYEEMIAAPQTVARAMSGFLGAKVVPVAAAVAGTGLAPGSWRHRLPASQAAEVEQVAGEELARLGYRD
jgi:hypothetical protein